MDPQDDPEARIRELERSLADQARTSELGAARTSAWAGPSTPPPVSYGASFPTTSRGTTPKFGGWLIVLAVLILGGVALAAGVAVYKFSSSPITGSRPSMYGGDGSFTDQPSSEPEAPVSEIPASTAEEPTITALPGGNVSVSGVGKDETIACDDGVVTISGMSNTVVLTGHCATVTVSGVQNEVTVDSADTINASGFDNQVTYHSGSPIINNAGDSNVVEQG